MAWRKHSARGAICKFVNNSYEQCRNCVAPFYSLGGYLQGNNYKGDIRNYNSRRSATLAVWYFMVLSRDWRHFDGSVYVVLEQCGITTRWRAFGRSITTATSF